MVGHTGVFAAAVKAVETLDNCVKTIADCVLANHGHLLITADHGIGRALLVGSAPAGGPCGPV